MSKNNLHANQPFPRNALIGTALLLGLTLLVVAVVRISGLEITQTPTATPIESLSLRFSDRADGAVIVHDMRQNRVLTIMTPGTDNFIRGVLRSLARERRLHGIDSKPPFNLVRWADGRLSIEDPSTGRRIDLAAFGHTNANAFARFLEASEAV